MSIIQMAAKDFALTSINDAEECKSFFQKYKTVCFPALNAHDDLVAALESVISVSDRKTVIYDNAKAALAKAKQTVGEK